MKKIYGAYTGTLYQTTTKQTIFRNIRSFREAETSSKQYPQTASNQTVIFI